MSTRALLVSTVIITMMTPRHLLAQKPAADTVTPRFTIGSTHFVAGVARFEFADLDARVAAAGLPNVARTAATFGIGTDVRAGRMLFGASFQSLITRDNSSDAYRTRLGGAYTLLDVGVAVIDREKWSLYPIAGVGLTQLSVNIREIGGFTFDEGLARPSREIDMSGLGAAAHAGFLVERRFHRGDTEYALGVRGGITRSFGSQSWTSDAHKVNDGPSGVRGSYLRLMFSRPLRSRRDALLPAAGAVAQAAFR